MKYQTDALMIPFLFEDLLSIAKSLMDLIIKATLSIGFNFKTLMSLRKRLSTVNVMELRRKDVRRMRSEDS